MRFIAITEFGGPEVLQVRETAEPRPGPAEVLIRVIAAGVNRPDVVQRRGFYPAPPGASPIPGLEVAGEVVEAGAEVSQWRPGDRVCALANGGGYAERVAVPAAQCLPIPSGLSPAQAAALPETCFTVWTNVFDRAGLQPGESFLVHGGSSGIGTTAIQMAKALGAQVFTTAGSAGKCRACEELGATLAVNYREADFVEPLKAATDQRGVDVILDMVGGDYVARNIELAAVDGRIVNIAFLRGSEVELNLLPVMLKRLTLSGSTLRPQSPQRKAAIAASLAAKVWPLIEQGQIKPVIAAEFPLEEAQAAHRLMESSQHIGKIVLQVGEP
ncbi:NAD(P)H-quinone oxidoreductase [Exilibacterium tricleocarpae]|uniref:NAD(P)H-quinone oxidoreductase n=1 Tax=Exilibacterium tricleocarpae TaxID=2591008 RepID=A0A545TQU9_9GAMM|nr:NAD(P)H-quinone oxidoreductase [Exilibacterium tricleocarpae]TQV79501.1 NAD(P)H-quinone oxidoreductase [Exilibacterium tricleocarpae]